MSNYSMDISGDIGLADYSNIFDYLKIIDRDDNVAVSYTQLLL